MLALSISKDWEPVVCLALQVLWTSNRVRIVIATGLLQLRNKHKKEESQATTSSRKALTQQESSQSNFGFEVSQLPLPLMTTYPTTKARCCSTELPPMVLYGQSSWKKYGPKSMATTNSSTMDGSQNHTTPLLELPQI